MAEPEVGTVLAGHRLEAIAGRGGMGVVYRATHLRLGRTVALKVIAPELAVDGDFRRRFTRESELAAQIEHPNVIPLYEAGEEDGQLFIAMRYVEGTDLGAMIARQGRLEPRLAARIVAQTASALDAAHGRGLVHRDVKPANVLIAFQDGEAHAYLTDFGLTKAVSSQSAMTKTGMLVGTVDYIAPEQIEGRRLDARVDVYALGCVLFQTLTGSVPYPRDTDVAKLWAHTKDPPPSVLTAAGDIPPQFDDVIARAMAKDPDGRYLSAGDLGRAALAAADRKSTSRAERSVAAGAAAPDAAGAVPAGEPTIVGAPATVRQPGGGADRAAPAAGVSPTSAPGTEISPPRVERAGASGASAGVPGARPGSDPSQRPRLPAWRALLAAGSVLAIALAILAVSGVFSTSSHPSVPSTKTGAAAPTSRAATAKTYVNSALGVRFSYPASWYALTLKGAVADFGNELRRPMRRCALSIERGVVPAGSSQEAQFAFVRARSAVAARIVNHYELRAIQAEHGANIAGVGLIRIAGRQGGHLGFFFRGRDVYFFDCVTSAPSLDRVDQQEFRPLLATVRIN